MDTKKWYLSKGVWGGALTLLFVILSALRFTHFGPVLTGNLIEQSDSIAEMIIQGIMFVTSMLALWGRLTAKAQVTK